MKPAYILIAVLAALLVAFGLLRLGQRSADPDHAQATADSVADLGAEVRADRMPIDDPYLTLYVAAHRGPGMRK